MRLIQSIHSFVAGGDDRTARMKRNSLSMLCVKGLSVLISLAYVPMMLSAVDRADYGVLLTLTSIVQWVAMLDIGLGNGLRNSLVGMIAQNEYPKARKCIGSCYASLAIYVSALIMVFLAVAPHLSWQNILNAPQVSEHELLGLARVVFVAFCFQFVANLITPVLYACQQPAYTSYISLASQAVNFCVVFVMVKFFGETSILRIGSVTCIIPPLMILLSSVILYRTRLKDLAPSFREIDFRSVSGILSVGVKFFILQIITIVLFQANSIIIAQVAGPDAVVEYNIAYKYIGVITIAFTIIVTPVWSASTDAFIRGDVEWIRNTVSYLRKVWLAVMAAGLLMVLLSKTVYHVWLGEEYIDIPYLTTALIMSFVAFDMLYRIFGTIINGTGKLFAQMVITSFLAILYVPLAVLLGRSMGLQGVLVANTIVFAGNYVWSRIQLGKLLDGTASSFWNK